MTARPLHHLQTLTTHFRKTFFKNCCLSHRLCVFVCYCYMKCSVVTSVVRYHWHIITVYCIPLIVIILCPVCTFALPNAFKMLTIETKINEWKYSRLEWNFDSLLALAKEYITNLWEVRKVKRLYALLSLSLSLSPWLGIWGIDATVVEG